MAPGWPERGRMSGIRIGGFPALLLAGATLGPLKNPNQGVIRVLDGDGSDMDSAGTIRKRLRVVSTFEFALN